MSNGVCTRCGKEPRAGTSRWGKACLAEQKRQSRAAKKAKQAGSADRGSGQSDNGQALEHEGASEPAGRGGPDTATLTPDRGPSSNEPSQGGDEPPAQRCPHGGDPRRCMKAYCQAERAKG